MKQQKKLLLMIGLCIIGIVILTGVGIFIWQHNNTPILTSNAQFQTGGFRSGSFANAGFANGSIASVNGDTVIINDNNDNGQTIVIISNTTTIQKSQATIQSKVVTIGNSVLIQASRSGDTITATTVTLQPEHTQQKTTTSRRGSGFKFSGGRAFGFRGQNSTNATMFIGKITQTGTNTFSISSFNGTELNIHTANSTTYAEEMNGNISDLASGQTITVTGTKDTTGAIQARSVMIQTSSNSI